jgi:nicotinamide-nucleotide amidase
MRIEIICTGDEVLAGKIVNTNFVTITQKLEDAGLSVIWGTTVGDDRDTLLEAFRLAGTRADAVIVNGGLGPTVDDLSQEIAARAAGVELELNEAWLARMEAFFTRRGRTMPPNNTKQAMLPAGAEMLDNPIGTACGWAMDIGGARFFFTPGVPRELRRMLEEQIIPRLLARGGAPAVIRLKRYHGYGLGESHVDALLAGLEALDPEGGVKLGFRAHYPQIETKLTVRGASAGDVARRLAPVDAELRRRLGNFIVAEDDQTLEGAVLACLAAQGATLAVVESFTGGQIASRLLPLEHGGDLVLRATASRDPAQLLAAVGLGARYVEDYSEALASEIAEAARKAAGASHALAVLIHLDAGADGLELGGTIWVAIATRTATVVRRARILGGREWIRLGAVELGLDCLRRHLQGLPVQERTDFEKH